MGQASISALERHPAVEFCFCASEQPRNCVQILGQLYSDPHSSRHHLPEITSTPVCFVWETGYHCEHIRGAGQTDGRAQRRFAVVNVRNDANQWPAGRAPLAIPQGIVMSDRIECARCWSCLLWVVQTALFDPGTSTRCYYNLRSGTGHRGPAKDDHDWNEVS